MSAASPDKTSTQSGASHSPTPGLSDVELEAAVLRSVVETRPVGQHKHILMIQLQAELHRRTGVWLLVGDLWDKIGVMFDLDKLDSMASPPSLPDSPQELSPLPRSKTHRGLSASSSPLSSTSRSPSPAPAPDRTPSKSAQCINSTHFRSAFTLPYLRLGQDEWKPHLYVPPDSADSHGHGHGHGGNHDSGNRRRSRSVASSSTRPETDDGFMMVDAEPEMSEGEEKTWHEIIYKRAEGTVTDTDADAGRGTGKGKGNGDEGGKEDEDEQWDAGVTKQLEEADKAREAADQAKKGVGKAGKKKKGGRPSKGRAAREASSELSDEGAEEEEEEGEEEAPKTGRGKRVSAAAAASAAATTTTTSKRKRNSMAKEESEEEKDVKETKTRRKKR